MPKSNVIDVKRAELRTASVEIQSLIIDGRKMTLSVFRQIPNEQIIDWETGNLRGTPWGQVNYFWGDQDDTGTHILWQKDQSLRRAILWKTAKAVETLKLFDEMLTGKFISTKIERTGWRGEQQITQEMLGRLQTVYSVDKVILSTTDAYQEISDYDLDDLSVDWAQEDCGQKQIKENEECRAWIKTAWNGLQTAFEAKQAIERKTNRNIRSLHELPQLFIAV